MTVTAAQLKARHPALALVTDTNADVYIAAAESRLFAGEFGTSYDEAVMFQAAHLATVDPAGINARQADKKGGSIYQVELDRIVRSNILGVGVA